jgi:hypothetical protein
MAAIIGISRNEKMKPKNVVLMIVAAGESE